MRMELILLFHIVQMPVAGVPDRNRCRSHRDNAKQEVPGKKEFRQNKCILHTPHTLISKVVVFEDKIQIHFESAGLAGLLKEAGADFEIADGNQVLDCVITVPCLLRRSSGKLEIQVEREDISEQPVTPLEDAGDCQQVENGSLLPCPNTETGKSCSGHCQVVWENRQPETLTLDKLRKGIPESWEEQRKLFLP